MWNQKMEEIHEEFPRVLVSDLKISEGSSRGR